MLYNLTDPPFTHKSWTLGQFEVHFGICCLLVKLTVLLVQLPSQLGQNGSFSVTTAAIFSDPGCVAAPPVRRHSLHQSIPSYTVYVYTG